MTSGVKQALPQVLMPKTGLDGKAGCNRAPQGDFVEALGIGKVSKQPKPAEAKAGGQEIEAKPLWQRLAAKLDTPDRTPAPKPEAVAAQEPAEKEAVEDRPPAARGEDVGDAAVGDDARSLEARIDAKAGDVATIAPPAPRQAADHPAQAPASPPLPEPASVEPPQQPAARVEIFRAEPALPAEPDAVVTSADSKAPRPALPDTARKLGPDAPVFVPMGRSEPAEPIRFEPAAAPAAAPAEQPTTDRPQAKEVPVEAPAEPPKQAPRVTVLAQQSIPAPMPSTAVALAESIAAGDLLAPARSVPALDAIHASATHASAQSLKIQLHPAELGMVTATLRFAGDQLSIELQVENHEAFRHLSSDSETIVRSLRDIGYEIDRVTVLQPQIATTPAGRSEAGGSLPSPQGRTPEQFGSGASPGGNGGSGDRQPSDGGNQGHGSQRTPAAAREQQGNGLYI